MAIKTKYLKENVVVKASERIKNLFESINKVYLNVSGGKDSIVLMNLVYEYIQENPEKAKILELNFIDEEAMFEDVIDIVKLWRKRFMQLGVKFNWFCIEVKHYNCLNQLAHDESFITWDRDKKDRWVREMPDFAITNHRLLKPRQETYQSFLDKFTNDGVTLIGLRMQESVHRMIVLSIIFGNKKNKGGLTYDKMFYPIYDWKDSDVWKYIKEKELEFPETYIRLFQVNTPRNKLRISQFFSIDTTKVLIKLSEHDPSLMDRVIKREPNAYLASLYWDSEMFRKVRVSKDKGKEQDFKKKTLETYKKYLKSPDQDKVERAKYLRKNFILPFMNFMQNNDWKKAYEVLVAGDAKSRQSRAFLVKMIKNKQNEK